MLTFRPTWEWDVAAGALIVEEAGGVCTTRNGGKLMFNNATPQLDGVIAASTDIHSAIMSALSPR